MATPQPLMSVAFHSGGQDYRLTSRGKLFVLDPLREVTHQVLAQRILYGELAKYLTSYREEELE